MAAGGEQGTAQLWVTRDRGAELLVDARGRGGANAHARARLEGGRETRYGGRYVQSVNGIEGSLGEQHDWFWFVNGYEGDRSAASYTLRDGDVAWFDYRAWQREGEARVVVGAFPEPFIHGYEGRRAPRSSGSRLWTRAHAFRPYGRRRLDRVARNAGSRGCECPRAPRRVDPRLRRSCSGETAGDPVRFVLSGNPDLSARYEVP